MFEEKKKNHLEKKKEPFRKKNLFSYSETPVGCNPTLLSKEKKTIAIFLIIMSP